MDWSSFFESSNPYSDNLLTKFSPFQRLIWIRYLRQDCLVYAIEEFIQEILGPKFIEQGQFDLLRCFEDSTNVTPLLFIMTKEMENPIAKILEMARSIKFDQEKILIYSISDADAPELIKIIESNLKAPNWIVIENIHASISGLHLVATFVEQLTSESAHPDFRLWISTISPVKEGFSSSLLQRCIKMIDTPRDGIKGLVKKSLNSDLPTRTRLIDAHPQKALLQGFISPICLLHAVLQERQKFAPLGWSLDYEFNESDLQLSFQILHDILNEPEKKYQLESVIYLIGKAIYGGYQSSNVVDNRVLEELVNTFLNMDNIKDSGKKTKAIIDGLNRHTDPNILGIHSNANQEVNFEKMEESVAKILKILDRKDLMALKVIRMHGNVNLIIV